MKLIATDLAQFVQSTLAARSSSGVHMVGGPAVAIDPRASAVLVPVLREFISDSVAGDRHCNCELAIAWSCDDMGRCIIELNERGAPRAGEQAGVGTIEQTTAEQRSLLQQAGDGMVRFELSDGRARIIVPARYVSEVETAADYRADPVVIADPLAGRSVLVVEDQLIIALDLEMLLREQGALDVQLCGSADEALKCLASDPPDVAILDVNLGSKTSFPVAKELQRLGVPFIFATGYSNEVEFPRELRSVPLVGKPYCADTMKEALRISCQARTWSNSHINS